MTDVINGRSVTDGGDVRVGVRVPEMPLNGARRGGSPPGSAHARAIPRDPDVRPRPEPSKLRNFASSHGGDAKAAVAASWLVNDRPLSLADVARRVWPGKGERRRSLPRWVGALLLGVFRLAIYTLAYLLALAVDTDKRAAVAFSLTLLTVAVIVVARSLPA